ncbi:IS1380 family transposase [Actinoplanes awajinensis]|uniref:Transposase n=1 Tax=Actinoplanes awajinensis subsp. mycoplanecinus TaxID=135947 RepID=A0A101JIT7_9ACTN|nr:IS1380 family transposase [Actinoplanes awajinensis]KUL27573.1 transposase [Actinoplanes awajinensis subsp. mycoplanecinus]
MKTTRTRPKIIVSGDGRGVVGHAGTRLLADLTDATVLSSAFSEALAVLRQRRGGHDPGRIAVDLAVLLADGGEAIADLAVLRDQPGLFGPVASDPTAWRLFSQLDATVLAELRAARARAREVAWAQHAEVRGDLPQPMVAGRRVDGLVLDIDATIVICHSEKESATRTWKKTFGFHPLLCFLDNTGEALAGLLREGRAGSNTTADHITVLDQALEQVPDAVRHGTPILLRSDSAGSSHGFLAHIRALRDRHLDIRFSVGAAITEPVRQAIQAVTDWAPAVDADGDLREHAEVCEITGMFQAAGWPEGTRFVVRRERPHPGAQLSLFDTIEGWRHQVVATDTPAGHGGIQYLEARHRAHARVEDKIRTGKNTGFGRFPSRVFAINQAWLQVALTGIDLLAWTQALLLDGDLATAEPKKLRYRLLHVAARITRTARRTRLAIATNWPWTGALTSAFTNLAALPQPTG